MVLLVAEMILPLLQFNNLIRNCITPKSGALGIGVDRIFHELLVNNNLAFSVGDKCVCRVEELNTSGSIGVALQLEIDFLNNGPGCRLKKVIRIFVAGKYAVQHNDCAWMVLANLLNKAKVSNDNGIRIALVSQIVGANRNPPDSRMELSWCLAILQAIQEVLNSITTDSESNSIYFSSQLWVEDFVERQFVSLPGSTRIAQIKAIEMFNTVWQRENLSFQTLSK
jgi:hypothetical protein